MSQRSTKENFIEKAREIHGNKYDYSKVEYKNNRTKVCIICPEHGEFWQTPRNHISQRQGCPKCSKTFKNTTESFIEKARKVHRDKYDYSKVEYKNNRTKVCIICPEHGEFWQKPDYHLSGCGCPKCGLATISTKIKKTQNEFIASAKNTHGERYDYSKVEYRGKDEKVCIICPEHGEFWQTPHNHVHGQGCPICGKINGHEKQKISQKEFIERSEKIHQGRYDYSKTEYKNIKTKVCITCPKHGDFWQSPGHHLNGHGCPSCNISVLEEEIAHLLDKMGIKYEREKKFDWLVWKGKLKLDFYLPEFSSVIECQGIQHFEPTDFSGYGLEKAKQEYEDNVFRDTLKNNLCSEHGIKIYYFSRLRRKYKYYLYHNKKKMLKDIKNER